MGYEFPAAIIIDVNGHINSELMMVIIRVVLISEARLIEWRG